MSERYELVELDPTTGEVDGLVAQGTQKAMSREMASMIKEFQDSGDWDERGQAWPVWAIRPAS